MSKPYLLRRNNRYFLRLHIPLDVRRWFDGKPEIRRSLKTMQYNTAKTRLRVHLYRIERVFTMMRCGMLSDEQIRNLVANYFRDSLQDTERDRAINVKPLDPEDHAYRQEGLDLHLTTMKEDFTHGQYERYVTGSVETVIERAGIPVEKGSDEYKVLCRELMKGLIEATGIEIERMTGVYRREYGEPSSGVGGRVAVEGGASAEGGSKVDEGRLLSVLIPEYLSECATGGRWSARTQKEGKSYFNLFLSLVGDRGIKSLDRRAFNDYRTLLTRWPKNVKQKSEYRGKSVGEILELSKGTKAVLSTSSVNQHIGNIQAFMKWCLRNGYADADYSEGLAISTRKERADEKREQYSREDLQRLITSPLYTGKKIARGKPERY